jgi:hypothetical protein
MTNVSVENNDNQRITLASFNKLVGVLNLGIKIGVFIDIAPKVDTPMGLGMVFVNINDYGNHT